MDSTGIHVYQPGFLYVAVGQEKPCGADSDPETRLLRREIKLVVDSATLIDAAAQKSC